MQTLDTAKRWFAANVDRVLEIYGAEHCLHREDVVLGRSPSRSFALDNVDFTVFSHRYLGRTRLCPLLVLANSVLAMRGG